MTTCYMCDAAPTGAEHVPPAALFPERKDLPPGVDYRRNLIKVPSCDAHNQKKSKDDEYLLYVLSLAITANAVGSAHARTKVMRAFERRPALLLGMLKGAQRVFVREGDGPLQETGAFQPDHARIKRSLDMLARALLFHHYQRRAPAVVQIHIHFMAALAGPTAVAENAQLQALNKQIDDFMADLPRHGANPEVFFYKAREEQGHHIMRLTFYGSSHVTCFLSPEPNPVPKAPYATSLNGAR